VCRVTNCIRADEVLAGVAGVVGQLPPGTHVAVHEGEIQLLLWQQRAREAETRRLNQQMDRLILDRVMRAPRALAVRLRVDEYRDRDGKLQSPGEESELDWGWIGYSRCHEVRSRIARAGQGRGRKE
jgi:hypothetical protein